MLNYHTKEDFIGDVTVASVEQIVNDSWTVLTDMCRVFWSLL